MHAQTFKNPEKVPFSSCPWEVHVRLMKKNEEKILLVSDCEWVPKAGWHPKAGCSFGIFLFLIVFLHEFLMSIKQYFRLLFRFSSWALHESLVRMMEKVLFMILRYAGSKYTTISNTTCLTKYWKLLKIISKNFCTKQCKNCMSKMPDKLGVQFQFHCIFERPPLKVKLHWSFQETQKGLFQMKNLNQHLIYHSWLVKVLLFSSEFKIITQVLFGSITTLHNLFFFCYFLLIFFLIIVYAHN